MSKLGIGVKVAMIRFSLSNSPSQLKYINEQEIASTPPLRVAAPTRIGVKIREVEKRYARHDLKSRWPRHFGGILGQSAVFGMAGGRPRNAGESPAGRGLSRVSPLHAAREVTETSLHGVEFENAFSIELEDFVTCTSCALPQIRAFRSQFAGHDGSYQAVPLGLPTGFRLTLSPIGNEVVTAITQRAPPDPKAMPHERTLPEEAPAKRAAVRMKLLGANLKSKAEKSGS